MPQHANDRPDIATAPRASTGASDEPSYRVWAPHAQHLQLHLNGTRCGMQRGPGDWWTAAERPQPGASYGYVIDGEGPFPDPRSASQPLGVHGLSEIVDHGHFQWTDKAWQPTPLASGVLYELHIGTFSEAGTFAGAIGHLAELVDLGVTHVELMPVAEFAGDRGWGYDGVDLFAPHHAYGCPDDLKALVDACHARGLAVLLDVVYNHLGPAGNYLSRFGPYFTHRYETPWGEALNLDGPGSDDVRRFVCDNAVMWLRDYHFDGLRVDAVHALFDMSPVHILEQLASAVGTLAAALGRQLVVIAESDLNDPRVVSSRAAGGYGLDAQWSDDFHHALHAVITGERSGYYEDFGDLAHLAKALGRVFVYAGDYSPHRRRTHGRAPVDIPGWRFVVAAQNHDQIGNRARGERLSHLVSIERVKVAAAVLLCSPFVPMLFQGEEWGASTPFQYFTAHDDELGALVRDGRRREFAAFGWNPEAVPDPQSFATYDRCRLRWDERAQPPHAAVLDWHRRLIALRRATPALRDGNYRALEVNCSDDDSRLVLRRGDIVVACNLSPNAADVPVHGARELLLASVVDVTMFAGGVHLPPDSVAVLRAGPERSRR